MLMQSKDAELHGRILVIDDTESARTTLDALLRHEGYELIEASSGETGLEMAAREQPDAIVLDVMMPGMDGFTVCERLRADPDLSHIPVLMVTALSETQSHRRGLEAGADDIISKPYERWELRARLGTLVRLGRAQKRVRERERLQWQLSELDPLAPQPDEWPQLDAEHTRLAHAQALLEAAGAALQSVSEGEPSADALAGRAADALEAVARYDPQLSAVTQVLQSAQAQLQDAAHTLRAYLAHHDPDPGRLAELDRRMSTWLQLARRHRRAPAELPALWQEWQAQLQRLDASADEQSLARAEQQALLAFEAVARQASAARQACAPVLGAAITQAMQHLGMPGGRFEIGLPVLDALAAHGLEDVEFRVAGHAGASPQPLARVASGGAYSGQAHCFWRMCT
jgi:DNA repair ATPase RecN